MENLNQERTIPNDYIFGAYWEKYTDRDGRSHRLYTVRSLGPCQGFCILDVTRNSIVRYPFKDRDSAWAYLKGLIGWDR
jgi:hypothetical protein